MPPTRLCRIQTIGEILTLPAVAPCSRVSLSSSLRPLLLHPAFVLPPLSVWPRLTCQIVPGVRPGPQKHTAARDVGLPCLLLRACRTLRKDMGAPPKALRNTGLVDPFRSREDFPPFQTTLAHSAHLLACPRDMLRSHWRFLLRRGH